MRKRPAAARIVDEREKEDAFAAATVALAASGTVTTEVALQGTPLVIGYKLGWITWAAARAFLFKSKYATLMNVAADAEVAPEFIQTRFTAAEYRRRRRAAARRRSRARGASARARTRRSRRWAAADGRRRRSPRTRC